MEAKGYIFDLDGTLTLTQQLHHQAYAAVFEQYGLHYTREDDQRFAGQGSKTIFPKFFAEHNKTITAEEIEKLAAQKKSIYDQIVEQSEIKTVPGIENFLKQAKGAGKKITVATGNKLEATEKILKKTNILEYFEQIVAQHEVKNQKPAPDIFLLAAKKIGIKPEECVVFEDGINGVIAAKAANIPCIGLSTGVSKDELLKAGALKAVNDYNELLNHLP